MALDVVSVPARMKVLCDTNQKENMGATEHVLLTTLGQPVHPREDDQLRRQTDWPSLKITITVSNYILDPFVKAYREYS